MGRRCCIAGCQSTSRLPEHHGVTYHSFPLDANIRATWINNTRLSADRQITKSVLVCSRHFRRNDFQPIRNGKYLLKARVFPTVFPWGKLDPAQVEAEQQAMLKNATADLSSTSVAAINSSSITEDVTKATVEATVAQIMAEAAELNAAAAAAVNNKSSNNSNSSTPNRATISGKTNNALLAAATTGAAAAAAAVGTPFGTPTHTEATNSSDSKTSSPMTLSATATATTPNTSPGVKYEPATYFVIGARLQAQRSDGLWYIVRILEVSDDGEQVRVRFERNSRNKMTYELKPEWVNKKNCRQRVNPHGNPVFQLEERCLARWSGPHKFPGTIKKIMENDTYEVLFDDGYTKNVRALHMKKLPQDTTIAAINTLVDAAVSATATPLASGATTLAATSTPVVVPLANAPIVADIHTSQTNLEPITPIATQKSIKASTASSSAGGGVGVVGGSSSNNKKRSAAVQRKDWPLLDMTKLDLVALNLPAIPRDGEWTCHWVNDQPIGTEGFLIVGEHRKPTVIVEDWRLPAGWIKHMYQRSNVLGKWDVILVSPGGKRFRSKSDLKVYLEDQGIVYNPDIYDFSIHRRRAKDINAYVFTTDYQPQQPVKPKALELASLDNTLDDSTTKLPLSVTSTPLAATPMAAEKSTSSCQYMETPVASLVPPMELMSPQQDIIEQQNAAAGIGTPDASKFGDGFVYIGGLKVQIIDNLFRCPHENCTKNFRKEDHVLIHIKHYHKDMAKLVSDCPKMQELAVKRTHPTSLEPHETHHKNQIPNQQFFAKLHQQDLQQSRSFKRSAAAATAPKGSLSTSPTKALVNTTPPIITTSPLIKDEIMDTTSDTINITEASSSLANSPTTTTQQTLLSCTPDTEAADISFSSKSSKRARFSPSKRLSGSRKSNRQRTMRRFVTAATATRAIAPAPSNTSVSGEHSSMQASDFEESRQSFNATPDARPSEPKRRRIAAVATSVSSLDSPATADSVSTPNSNDLDTGAPTTAPAAAQYIKENGELIKIVCMRVEEIINCICGYCEEDGLMIQCELCLCWQHGACNGIAKESDVPEKYVCYICRNPVRGRDSMRYKHDQDWLYEGKLPVANYHMADPNISKKFEFLKKSHTLTGNLIETKRFMHSLRVKINIANNRMHPKLYLWAKKWDEDDVATATAASDADVKLKRNNKLPEQQQQQQNVPHIPQPEAAIHPEECQVRLVEHLKVQQSLVMQRLLEIETEIDALEREDELPDLKNADISQTKEALAVYIKELETLRNIAKINTIANKKEDLKNNANASFRF